MTSSPQALLHLLLYLICICIYFYLGSSAWVMEIIFIFSEALNCLFLGAEKGTRSLLLSYILWQNIIDLVLTINLSNNGRRTTSYTCFKQDVNRHTYVTLASTPIATLLRTVRISFHLHFTQYPRFKSCNTDSDSFTLKAHLNLEILCLTASPSTQCQYLGSWG